MSKQVTQIAGGIVGALAFLPLAPLTGWLGYKYGGELWERMQPKIAGGGYQRDPNQTIRSAKAPAQYALGKFSTGGLLMFAQESPGEDTDGEKLILVYAISEGYVDIDTIWINEEPFTISGASGIAINIWRNRTTSNNTLMTYCPDWREDMVGSGITYISLILTFGERFSSGVPQVRFEGRGLALYDPRTQVTAYSNNVALVALWYLREKWHVPDDEIDMQSFINAASICDEMVNNPDGTQSKRYTFGGIIQDDKDGTEIMSAIEAACAGEFVRVGGKWGFMAGAYVGPSQLTITQDYIIGAVNYRSEVDNAEAINTIRGTFVDPANQYTSTDYPQAQNTDWVLSDGLELVGDFKFDFVTDVYQAQRLAWINLKKRRTGGSISLNTNMYGYAARPGMVVTVDLPLYNIQGEFLVESWSMSEGGCALALRAYNAQIYVDAVGRSYNPIGAISLPTGGIPAVTGLNWLASLSTEIEQGRLRWNPPAMVIDYYSVVIRNSSQNVVQTYQVPGASISCIVDGLPAGTYTMSVSATSGIRHSGDATISVSIAVPAMPQQVSYTATLDSITINCLNLTTDINGGTYEYYYSQTASINPPVGTTYLGRGQSFTHSGLPFDTIYHYYIRTINSYGVSDFYHLEAQTSNDISQWLDSLTGNISEGMLTPDLLQKIDSIDSVIADIDILNTDVPALQQQVTMLQGEVDQLLNAPSYDQNEAAVNKGELRVYEGHIYRALNNMTAPIPLPTDTTNWEDIGEWQSWSDLLGQVLTQMVSLTDKLDDGVRKIDAVNVDLRRQEDDTEGDLWAAVNTWDANARITQEETVRANEDFALAETLRVHEVRFGENEASISDLDKAFADEHSAVAQQLDILSAGLSDANMGISANGEVISGLKTEITDIDGRVTVNSNSVDRLRSDLDNPASGLPSKATSVALTQLETRVTAAEGEIVSESQAITELQSDVADLETGLSSQAGALNELTTHVSDVEDELGNRIISASATANIQLNAAVQTLEGEIAANAQDITTVRARVSTIDGEVNTIQAQRTMKVQVDAAGNYVTAGIGLIADGTTQQSQIMMHADQFMILDGTAVEPFSADHAWYSGQRCVYENGVYEAIQDMIEEPIPEPIDTYYWQYIEPYNFSEHVPFYADQTGVYMDNAFIKDASIGNAKIADLSVDNAKIADLSVDNAKIADLTITNAKIGDAEIDSLKIADGAITSLKIAQQIQSDNYSPNNAGWMINRNGTAEFEKLIVRGKLSNSYFDASSFYILSSYFASDINLPEGQRRYCPAVVRAFGSTSGQERPILPLSFPLMTHINPIIGLQGYRLANDNIRLYVNIFLYPPLREDIAFQMTGANDSTWYTLTTLHPASYGQPVYMESISLTASMIGANDTVNFRLIDLGGASINGNFQITIYNLNPVY